MTNDAGAVIETYVTAHTLDDDGDWTQAASEWTNASGEYVLGGLLPGTRYRIRFAPEDDRYGRQFYLGAAAIEDAQDVVATEAGTLLEAVTLAEVPSISGIVTSNGVAGVADVRVSLYALDEDGDYWWRERTTWSDPDGRYGFVDLTLGATYRVGFSETGDYAPTFYGVQLLMTRRTSPSSTVRTRSPP